MKLTKRHKQIFLLYGASVVGLLVGVLNSVLNTRSLPPDLYGNVRYVQNIINFISSLLLVGYFTSGSRLLAISKNSTYSRSIRGAMCVILGIALIILMLSMTVLYFYNKSIGVDNMTLLYLIAIPVCGNALMLDYVNTTAQGDNFIGRIAISRCLPYTIYFIIAYFIYRKFGANPELMLLLYNGIAVIILSFVIISTKPSFKGLKTAFKALQEENKEYGFKVYVGSLIAVSTQYLAGISLGHFCDDNANVGFYTLALTLATPLTMLPSIIGTTYFKEFASSEKINKKILLGSVGFTIVSFIVFVIAIKYVVAFLYDTSYQSVGKYAAFIAIGTSLHGLGDFFNRFLGSHAKGKEIRNGALASGLMAIFGNIVFVYLWNINGAVLTRVLCSIIYFSMMFLYYRKFIKEYHS